MKMTRRLLALLLAFCLTFGNVMPAMATELTEEPVVTEEPIVVPEVKETEAPAEEPEETEAPAEPEITEAPAVEPEVTEAPVVEPEVTEAPTEAPAQEPEETEAPTEAPIVESEEVEAEGADLTTPAEIVDAAYALEVGASLEGTYTLTGTITSVNYAYNATYGNISVTMECEGKAIYCYKMTGTGIDQIDEYDVITVTGTLKNYNGTIEFDPAALESYEKGDAPATPENVVKYTFSEYTAGVQYAKNEEHVLDDVVTVISDGGHFTTQLRLYDSSTNDATAVIKSTKYIESIVLNAGKNAATLNVYGSNDGATWSLIEDVSVSSTFLDYTVEVTGDYNYLKLDADGAQIQVKYMTITFGGVASTPDPTPDPDPDPDPTPDPDPDPDPDPTPDPEETVAASIDFTSITMRTSHTDTQQVWANGKFTLTNSKESSSNWFDSNGAGHIRLYVGTKVTIAYPGMTKVVFTCTGDKNIEASSGLAGLGTLTIDGTTATLELDKAVNSITYVVGKQHRLTKIEVYGSGETVEEEVFDRPDTPAEIVDAVYALPEYAVLPEGPYTLTGKIVSVDTPFDSSKNYITVTIAVEGCEDKPIQCYHLAGEGVDNLAVGDTITVTGELKNYKGTREFDSNCSLDAVVKSVALIGEKYFASLQDAFDASKSGDVIELLSDIEMNAGAKNKGTAVLDLKGFTITGTDTTEKNFGLIDNVGNLTIQDTVGGGKILLTATINSGWDRYSAVLSNNPGGHLTVNGGYFEHLGGTDMAYGIDNLTNGKNTYAEVTINGGTIKSTYRGIRQFLNGIEAQNILTINGGTIEGGNKSVWMQDPSKNANTGSLEISKEATLIGDVYLSVTAGSTAWPVEIDIASEALSDGSKVTTSNVPAGYELNNVDGKYGVFTGVAKIGNEYYETLQAALDAAKSGDTIKLLSDATLEKAVTISGDLTITADRAVTITANGVVDAFTVTAGTLTLGENITIVSDTSVLWAKGGNVVVDGAVINATNSPYAIAFADAGSTLTIKAGTITTNSTSAVAAENGGIVNISGGLVETTSEDPNMVAAFARSGSVINVTGGEVKAAADYALAAVTGGTVNVSDGTITGGVVAREATSASATITGGTINGPVATEKGATITITGGKFSTDVSALLAEGYVQHSDGTVAMRNSEQNPTDLTADLVYEGDFSATVTIPAGETYYFSAQRISGMDMYINDMFEANCTTAMPMAPYTWSITNWDEVDAEFVITVEFPMGHQMNPVALERGEQFTSVPAGCVEGYHYTYTAEADGEMTFYITNAYGYQFIENNPLFDDDDEYLEVPVKANIVVTNANTYVQMDTMVDGDYISVDVSKDDELIIQIFALEDEAGNMYPEGDVSWVANYSGGSALNPEELYVDIGGDGMSNYCYVETDDEDGFLYTWTAEAAGMLTIEMKNSTAGWAYKLNEGEWHYSFEIPTANKQEIEVVPGDVVNLAVNTCGGTKDSLPGGMVVVDTFFKRYITEDYPIDISEAWNWNDEGTEKYASVMVPANTTYYYQTYLNGTWLLTINDGEPIEVQGSFYDPIVFAVENNTKKDAEFFLCLTPYHAVGSMGNPAKLELGETVLPLAEGSDGYHYTYTAKADGILTFAISAESGWTYTINNLTSYQYGDAQWSDSDPVVNPATIEVAKGDEIQIIVNTYDPDAPWAAPAGDVTINLSAEYTYGVGEGATNPDGNALEWNADHTAAYGNIVVPANSSYYIAIVTSPFAPIPPQMQLNVNGEKHGMYGGTNFMPAIVEIVNDEDWDCGMYLELFFPYGTYENPEWIQVGKNTANVEAGGFYVFNYDMWTDGYLSFTMNTKENWSYTINSYNPETGVQIVYGDRQDASAGGLKTVTLHSNGNERFEVIVSTENGEAGKIDFTFAVAQKEAHIAIGKSKTLTFTDPATGKAISNSKVKWTIKGAWDVVTGDELKASKYASLKDGKLSSKDVKIPNTVGIRVEGTYKGQPNSFWVYLHPKATSMQINAYTPDGAFENANGQILTWTLNGPNGGGAWLQADAQGEYALDDVTWKSSNTKILKVNANGELMPVEKNGKVASGTVTITATAKDGSGKKASVKVKTVYLAQELEIAPKNGLWTIGSGVSVPMIATVDPSATNKAVEWSVTAGYEDFNWETFEDEWVEVPGIVSIDENGILTVAADLTQSYQATVTAVSKDAGLVEATCALDIIPGAVSINTDAIPTTYDLNEGEIMYLYGAYAVAADGFEAMSPLKWTSSDKKIAVISEDNTVFFTGKTGKVKLTATTTDGTNLKKTVTINVVKSPTEVTLSKDYAYLAAGKSLTLKATVGPKSATNKGYTWDVQYVQYNAETDETVILDAATVKAIGIKFSKGKFSVDAKKFNKFYNSFESEIAIGAFVTATANMACPIVEDGFVVGSEKAYAEAVVVFAPTTKKVAIQQHGLTEGVKVVTSKTITCDTEGVVILTASATPDAAGQDFTWKSSNTKIAKVAQNPDGSVSVIPTGSKTGTVTITAKATDGSGKSATVKVKVIQKVDEIKLDNSKFVLSGAATKKGRTFDLNKLATIAPAKATYKTLKWYIAEWDAELAAANKITVSSSGKLTAKMDVAEPISISVVAQATDGYSAIAVTKVTITPAATKVIIVDTEGNEVTATQSVKVKSSLTFGAKSEGENAADLFTWKSSNTKYAKVVVNADGSVSVVGVKAGTVTITATAKDGSGVKDTIKVKVVK